MSYLMLLSSLIVAWFVRFSEDCNLCLYTLYEPMFRRVAGGELSDPKCYKTRVKSPRSDRNDAKYM